jgi:hypothetical protein
MTDYELAEAYVSLELDEKKLNEDLAAAVKKHSALVKLGARTDGPVSEPVTFPMTTVMRIEEIPSGTVLESFLHQNFTTTIRGAETVIFHGGYPGSDLDPKQGKLADVCIIPNSLKRLIAPPSDLDRSAEDLTSGLENPNGIALSQAGFREIATATHANGVRKHPGATPWASFQLFDLEALRVPETADDSFVRILGVVGDYSKLYLNIRIESIEGKQDDDGSVEFTVNWMVEFENLAPSNFKVIMG